LLQVDMTKAIADGLVFRPLSETIRDTLAWVQRRPAHYVWQAGLSPEREARILVQWSQAQRSHAYRQKSHDACNPRERHVLYEGGVYLRHTLYAAVSV
jgi:hypothetical protein